MRHKEAIKNLLESVTEVYYKVRQVLQNVTEVYYNKFFIYITFSSSNNIHL